MTDNKPKFDTLAPFEKWLEQNNYYVSGSWDRFVNSDIDPKSYLGRLYLFWLKEEEKRKAIAESQQEAAPKSSALPATTPKFEIPSKYEPFKRWLQNKGLLQDFSDYSWKTFVDGTAGYWAKLSSLHQEYLRETEPNPKESYYKKIANAAYLEGGATRAMAVLDKKLAEERCQLPYASSQGEHDVISNNIAAILKAKAPYRTEYEQENTPKYKESKFEEKLGDWCTYIIGGIGCLVMLAILGVIWYYLCGGSMFFPSEITGETLISGPFDFIVSLVISIMLLAYLVFGFIGLFKR